MKVAEVSVNKPFHLAVCFNQKWKYQEDAKFRLFLNKYDFSDNRDSYKLKVVGTKATQPPTSIKRPLQPELNRLK